jgi:hypothetical protein
VILNRPVLVDGGLAVAFVMLGVYFYALDDPLVAIVWVFTAAAFGARAAGLLQRT